MVLNYWENDGKPVSTTIDDPGKGTSGYLFDPRCLGLGAHLSVGDTVENSLGCNGAQSIALVGEEAVDGTPAWHVRVQSQNGARLDFWLEVARSRRDGMCAVGPTSGCWIARARSATATCAGGT